MDGSEPRRYGRGLFLATVAGGLTSLAWGKPVWSRVSAALAPGGGAHPVRPDERLAHLHGVRLDAELRPGDVAPPGRRPRRAGARAQLRASCARCRAHQVSDFHCVTGWTVKNVHWTRRAHHRHLREGEAAARGERAAVRLGGEAVRRLPDDGAGAAPRRDARVRDGREAARARARRAGAARDPGDVRLQEREVAEADQSRARGAARLLGAASATTATRGSAARTATTREAGTSGASRGPSARCTG